VRHERLSIIEGSANISREGNVAQGFATNSEIVVCVSKGDMPAQTTMKKRHAILKKTVGGFQAWFESG